MSKGRLYVLSGPSGVGKDTVLQLVFKRCPQIKFSISSITRPMRGGEKQGEKYNFISREEFENMIAENRLLEYNVYGGNYYGTPLEPVERCIEAGIDIFVENDVNGAAQIREKCPDCVSIFIMPPSLSVLKQRLVGRGTETPQEVERRLNDAIEEIKRADEYDYIVTNDTLENAVEDIVAILQCDRNSTDRRAGIIDAVLNS